MLLTTALLRKKASLCCHSCEARSVSPFLSFSSATTIHHIQPRFANSFRAVKTACFGQIYYLLEKSKILPTVITTQEELNREVNRPSPARHRKPKQKTDGHLTSERKEGKNREMKWTDLG